MEVAAGLEVLALVHFAGNAFLRTYQLLVSPSAVTYLIREQFYHFEPKRPAIERFMPKRLRNTFYILSLREWNLDVLLHRLLWRPMKQVGGLMGVVSFRSFLLTTVPVLMGGIWLYFNQGALPGEVLTYVPTLFAFIGLVMVMRAFTERGSTRKGWTLVLMNHLWIALAVSFNEHFSYDHTLIYLSGIGVAFVVGVLAINRLRKLEPDSHLDRFHGFSHRHPKLGMVFLAACLGMAGFPISPTFIGEDLIFSHIHADQLVLAFLVASSFIVNGLALIRMYARLFLGPHDGHGREGTGLRGGAEGLRSGAEHLRSTALGLCSTALGLCSGALGLCSGALGLCSTALGLCSTALGLCSGALGLRSTALGLCSTALGLRSGAEHLRSGAEHLRSGAEHLRSGAELVGCTPPVFGNTPKALRTTLKRLGSALKGVGNALTEGHWPRAAWQPSQ